MVDGRALSTCACWADRHIRMPPHVACDCWADKHTTSSGHSLHAHPTKDTTTGRCRSELHSGPASLDSLHRLYILGLIQNPAA